MRFSNICEVCNRVIAENGCRQTRVHSSFSFLGNTMNAISTRMVDLLSMVFENGSERTHVRPCEVNFYAWKVA